jgi:hypothetical protein
MAFPVSDLAPGGGGPEILFFCCSPNVFDR